MISPRHWQDAYRAASQGAEWGPDAQRMRVCAYTVAVARRSHLLAGCLASVAVALALAGCGGAGSERIATVPALTPEQELRALVSETDSAPLSTTVPEPVREACQSAAEKSFVTVVCPRVVPAGQIGVSHTDKGVLLPRRTTLGIPGEDGERGEYRYRGSRRLYVLDFRSGGGLGNGHWLVGGGDPDDLAGEFLRTSDPSETPAERRYVRHGPHRIAVLRFPGYPTGGVNGGHVVASARRGGMLLFASVHDYEHEDVAIALLSSMLR